MKNNKMKRYLKIGGATVAQIEEFKFQVENSIPYNYTMWANRTVDGRNIVVEIKTLQSPKQMFGNIKRRILRWYKKKQKQVKAHCI